MIEILNASAFKWVRDMYRDMIEYYQINMGKKSKYGGSIITHKMVETLVKRYNQLSPSRSNIILNGRMKNAG